MRSCRKSNKQNTNWMDDESGEKEGGGEAEKKNVLRTTVCASALAVERLGDPDRFWQLLKNQELFRVDLQRHQEMHFKWPLRHVSKRESISLALTFFQAFELISAPAASARRPDQLEHST